MRPRVVIQRFLLDRRKAETDATRKGEARSKIGAETFQGQRDPKCEAVANPRASESKKHGILRRSDAAPRDWRAF